MILEETMGETFGESFKNKAHNTRMLLVPWKKCGITHDCESCENEIVVGEFYYKASLLELSPSEIDQAVLDLAEELGVSPGTNIGIWLRDWVCMVAPKASRCHHEKICKGIK